MDEKAKRELQEAADHVRGLEVMNEAIVYLVQDYNTRLKEVGLSVNTREGMVSTFQNWVLSQIMMDPSSVE